MQETPRAERRRRRLFLYSLTTAILLLAFLLFSQASLNLSFIQPNDLSQTLVLTALSAVIFLGFIALTFILARNLLKLYADRQLGVLGSRFRTRMLLGGLALSFLPVLFMFLFAYVLMNRSIDKWFSRPVEELREESAQVASLLSSYAAANARAEAITLAGAPEVREAFGKNDFSAVDRELKRHEANLQGGFVVLLQGEQIADGFRLPKPWIELRTKLLAALQEPRPAATYEPRAAQLLLVEGEQYLLGAERIGAIGRVVVAMPLPLKYAETIQKIEDNQRRYFELSRERRQVRRFYMQLLLLLTVLTLFAASWISIYTARLVTRPVTALAEGTKAISEGNLQYRVDITAADELGVLVSSFNRMASDLEQSRKKIEQSGDELSEKNLALEQANTAIEQRRREIETILQNVPTGVLSLDAERRLTHSNRAFDRLFAAQPQVGSYLAQIFDKNVAFDLERLLRRADRMATASRELELNGLQVEVTAASLQHDRQKLGYVLVFEDLSELLKAQKQVAWREVARRVAHEIKNPLTPIALSAERIRRHLERAQAPDAASLVVIQECAATITGAVETLRALVDEFSALARFPASQPQPADINQIIESALGLFHGRLEGITLSTQLAAGLPEVQADPEAIKRVIANLVDNAADAMQESLLREISISTSLLGEDSHGRESVEIVVTDTGHGVTKELKEKLFLPYFSTKERGTGLGLAIVSRIVEEHGGSIRVEENRPVGTRFIVELPAAHSQVPERRRLIDVSMNHILIIDDEPDIRKSLRGVLEDEGYKIAAAESAEAGLAALKKRPFDLVLLDIWLPGLDGLGALEEIKKLDAAPEVIMISGHGTIESAVRATKLGAFDFIEKPLSLERLLIVVKNALEAHRLESENRELRQQTQSHQEIAGSSVPMKALRQQIGLMAPTNGRVLIYGESGTGKELVARAIHAASLRKDNLFVEVNCAAIPEDLIESELFGHRKGSFPAATADKEGRFHKADGGTLFLDEVGDMSLKTQSKVLRSLDEQRFTPVGGDEPVAVDVRVIAATNKDLEEEIARGNFREDLFYRLNVIPFYVPPLRERKEDIPQLARHFLREISSHYSRRPREISEDAIETLMGYAWPGNVRELRNVIERVVIMNPTAARIERKHLPPLVYRDGRRRTGGEFTSLHQARTAYERDYILKKLDENHGNVSRTAEVLGLERSHMYRKMKTLGISVKE